MSMPQTQSETRRALNPLFNDNKLKLGLFGVNVSNGCAITTLDGPTK
jgi:dimethylsulfone monooxygenase